MVYIKFFACLLVSFASASVARDVSTLQVEAAFQNANVSLTMRHWLVLLLTLDMKIPEDIQINFNPDFLLDVTFPQPGGRSVPLTAGVQLPRNRKLIPRYCQSIMLLIITHL